MCWAEPYAMLGVSKGAWESESQGFEEYERRRWAFLQTEDWTFLPFKHKSASENTKEKNYAMSRLDKLKHQILH